MHRCISIGFIPATLALAATLFATTPARACVTCSDYVCTATSGNGAKNCSSWKFFKAKRCKLEGHCEISKPGTGGPIVPQIGDGGGDTASLVPLPSGARYDLGLFGRRQRQRRNPLVRVAFHVKSSRTS